MFRKRRILVPFGMVPKSITRPASAITEWDKIPLGVDEHGQEIVWDIFTLPHALIAGHAGTGKTIALKNIYQHCLTHPNEWSVRLIDAVHHEVMDNSGAVSGETGLKVGATKAGVFEMIREAHAEMLRRQEQMMEAHVTPYFELPEKPKAIMILIDDAYELFALVAGTSGEVKRDNEEKFEILALLGDIARLGRTAGIQLVVSTNRPDVRVFSGEFKQNLGLRYACGNISPSESAIILDSKYAPHIETVRGRGVVSMLGVERQIQGYLPQN